MTSWASQSATRIGITIAIAPDDAIDSNELLRCADIALYRAKHAGRETWRYYGDEPA